MSVNRQTFYSEHFQRDMYEMSAKYSIFIEIIKKLAPKRFLDLGCGDGSFAVVIKNKLGLEDVFGIDISGEAAQQATAKGIQVCPLDIDAGDLPFEANFFDCVFCGEVIEHVYSPDHLLEEIYRVLRRNGYLLLTTLNLASWFNRFSLLFGFQPIFTDISLKYNFGHLWKMNPAGHLRLYTLRSLKRLMEAYNFKIVKSHGIGINCRIGFGKSHPIVAGLANFIFKSPSWNSGILVLANKES